MKSLYSAPLVSYLIDLTARHVLCVDGAPRVLSGGRCVQRNRAAYREPLEQVLNRNEHRPIDFG